MKSPPPSRPARGFFASACGKLAALAVLAALTGCADTPWPTWLTGEPDESVLNAPRAIQEPPRQEIAGWPTLDRVPARPSGLSTPAQRAEAIASMTAAREEATRLLSETAPATTERPTP